MCCVTHHKPRQRRQFLEIQQIWTSWFFSYPLKNLSNLRSNDVMIETVPNREPLFTSQLAEWSFNLQV